MKPSALHLFPVALLLSLSQISYGGEMTISSNDIQPGQLMNKQHEFKGFGCDGGNLSPQLSWSNAPQGTRSFAISAFDPDAPTGSGWWHWQVINIPAGVHAVAQNAGSLTASLLPKSAVQIKTDYGQAGFGGACPPAGHGTHRYQFTVHALSVEQLDLPADASNALVGYMINANRIGSATLEALYRRDK